MKILRVLQKFGIPCCVIVASACGPMSPPVTEVQPSGQPDQQSPRPEMPGDSEEVPPNHSWQPRPPDEVYEAEKKDQICYPGNGAGPVCLALVAPTDVEFRTDYIYLDPQSSPSFPRGFDPKHYTPPKKFLHLPPLPAALPLAKNFGLTEFMSATKGSYGVFSPYVAAALQKIRDTAGRSMLLTSAYRSPSYNRSVGGANWSRHVYGDGVDIWADRSSKGAIASACRQFGAGFTLLYQTHVHCDWRAVGTQEVKEAVSASPVVHSNDVDRFMRNHMGIRLEGYDAGPEHSNRVFPGFSVLAKQKIVLTADYLDIEGEGIPELEWTIASPEGDEVHVDGQNAIFFPTRAGEHQLKLVVGGRYELRKKFVVR